LTKEDDLMETLKRLKNRIPSSVVKVLLVAEVLAAVEVLTHEPAAVAGAFATTVAALYYRRPARRCLGR
jgi:hypothetical protein